MSNSQAFVKELENLRGTHSEFAAILSLVAEGIKAGKEKEVAAILQQV